MGFLDKIFKGLGFESNEEEKPKEKKVKQEKPKQKAVKAEFKLNNLDAQPEHADSLNKTEKKTDSEISVFKPVTQNEVGDVIIKLKQLGRVVIDVSNMKIEDKTRSMDFVLGAIFALNGNIRTIENNKYLLEKGE